MVAAAVIGSAVVGGIASKSAGDKSEEASRAAGQVSQSGTNASIAESQRQYDTTRNDFAPYRDTGASALNRLNAASNGDYSSFQASPSYNFTRSEGQRDIGNSFAARGGAASGNALRALTQYNQNLASGQFDNWWNQQQGLANLGASGTSGTAQAGVVASNQINGAYQNNAANQANALYAGGNARASGISGIGNSLNQGVGNYLYYKNTFGNQSGLTTKGYAPSAYNVPVGP